MTRLPLILNIPQTGIPPFSAVPEDTTPVAYLANDALRNDYDAVCVPLTNDLWRERWEQLCLRSVDDDGADDEPPFGHSSAGGQGGAATREWIERERKRREIEKEAELWRSHGGFKRTELNITRLGWSFILCKRLHMNHTLYRICMADE